MADCYVGEIRMFAGTYAPEGWEMCNGQLLPISGYEALYTLIGTTYGGDGQTTFGLPDLRGRVPVSTGVSKQGINYNLGQAGGTETVTLTTAEMGVHTHAVNANSAPGTDANAENRFWAGPTVTAYEKPGTAALVAMKPNAISVAGGNQPHENMMPFMALTFIIATNGIFPSFN
ncbi:phage tail protein [Massilia alkalitolerans]|uniref:phage tail protein n=1 Tax=Massilia alkalitolerans TaxID=286638 RepID=UPI00047F80A8|nr:tail fiber protein [Massilia alkalitolerans]